MPRTRILFAALVATVLAVGASLAFREGELLKDDAGVRSLGTKSRIRPTKETRESRALRWEGNPNATRREKIEDFLRKNGRTAATLGAILPLAESGDYHAYAEELRAMRDDPVAMAFAACDLGDDSCAKRAMELEPENILPALREARLGTGDKLKPFIQAMRRSIWWDHRALCEEVSLEAALYVLDDVRVAWQTNVGRFSAGASELFQGDPLFFSPARGEEKDKVDRDLALALRKAAQMTEDRGDLYASSQWDKYIFERYSADELQRYLGLDSVKYDEVYAREEQSLWQSMDFARALDAATPEQIADLEKARHQMGLAAAKKQFFAPWRQKEIQEIEDIFREARMPEDARPR